MSSLHNNVKKFPATMPSLVKSWSDTPSTWNTDLRQIVQLAVSLARDEGEVASLVQLGMEKRFDFVGRWCVAAGRGQINYNARTRVGTRALLRVPCLARELRDGVPPVTLNQISVLIFQAASDTPLLIEAVSDAPLLGEVAAAQATSATTRATTAPPTPPNQQHPPRLPSSSSSRRPLLVDLPTSSCLISHAARAHTGSAHAARIVGGVLHTVGLHAGVTEAFAAGLRGALRHEWGSTWHVVVGAAAVAVAPPGVQPGEWIECELAPTGALDTPIPHDPSVRDKTPEKYRVIAFRTCPGAGEPPVRSQFVSAFVTAAAEPLILIRAVLYTIGFAAFIAFLGFSQGVDNTCSRLAGAGISRIADVAGEGGRGLRALFGSLGVFSTSAQHAATALHHMGLDAFADGGMAANSRCSVEAVVSADVRIVRGRFLLVAAGSAAVFAAFVVRYFKYAVDLSKQKRAAGCMREADAGQLARAARGVARLPSAKKLR
jgi:hypothetical protein